MERWKKPTCTLHQVRQWSWALPDLQVEHFLAISFWLNLNFRGEHGYGFAEPYNIYARYFPFSKLSWGAHELNTVANISLQPFWLGVALRGEQFGGAQRQVRSCEYFTVMLHVDPGSKPAYISPWELLLPARSLPPMSLQITCPEHTLACCLYLGDDRDPSFWDWF